MTRVTDELAAKVTAAISEGVTDDAMKALKKKVDDVTYEIEADIMYRLKEAIAPELSGFAVDMARKTVEAILEGNDDEMRRYLGCDRPGAYMTYTGRTTGYTSQRLEDQHPVIHGRLFEQGSIALRKKIVDAHRDLLTNERILDLEDQVKSLVSQVNKAKAENAQLRERLNS